MADYEEIEKVAVVNDGVPTELKLQRRLDQPPHPYYCLSWRTRYATAPGKSRRFYSSSKAGFWTIPVWVALDLLRRAAEECMLGFQYDDLRMREGTFWRTVIDSRALGVENRVSTCRTIVCNRGEPEWGLDPLFVICHGEGAGGAWREIMIVDSARESCTFRCTTTMVSYEMGIFADRLQGPWRMDNAMQDASAESMREFLRVLEEVSE